MEVSAHAAAGSNPIVICGHATSLASESPTCHPSLAVRIATGVPRKMPRVRRLRARLGGEKRRRKRSDRSREIHGRKGIWRAARRVLG